MKEQPNPSKDNKAGEVLNEIDLNRDDGTPTKNSEQLMAELENVNLKNTPQKEGEEEVKEIDPNRDDHDAFLEGVNKQLDATTLDGILKDPIQEKQPTDAKQKDNDDIEVKFIGPQRDVKPEETIEIKDVGEKTTETSSEITTPEGAKKESFLKRMVKTIKGDKAETPQETKEVKKSPEYTERTKAFIGQLRDQEKTQLVEKYGEGRWGNAMKYLNETPEGKLIKIGGKIAGGTLAMVGAGALSGGALLPLYAMGAKYVIDGVLEGIEYLGFEKPNRAKLKEVQDGIFDKMDTRFRSLGENPSPEAVVEVIKTIKEKEEKALNEAGEAFRGMQKNIAAIRKVVSTFATISIAMFTGVSIGPQDLDVNGVANKVKATFDGVKWILPSGREGLIGVWGLANVTPWVEISSALTALGAQTIYDIREYQKKDNLTSINFKDIEVVDKVLTLEEQKQAQDGLLQRVPEFFVDTAGRRNLYEEEQYERVPDSFTHNGKQYDYPAKNNNGASSEGDEDSKIKKPAIGAFVGSIPMAAAHKTVGEGVELEEVAKKVTSVHTGDSEPKKTEPAAKAEDSSKKGDSKVVSEKPKDPVDEKKKEATLSAEIKKVVDSVREDATLALGAAMQLGHYFDLAPYLETQSEYAKSNDLVKRRVEKQLIKEGVGDYPSKVERTDQVINMVSATIKDLPEDTPDARQIAFDEYKIGESDPILLSLFEAALKKFPPRYQFEVEKDKDGVERLKIKQKKGPKEEFIKRRGFPWLSNEDWKKHQTEIEDTARNIQAATSKDTYKVTIPQSEIERIAKRYSDPNDNTQHTNHVVVSIEYELDGQHKQYFDEVYIEKDEYKNNKLVKLTQDEYDTKIKDFSEKLPGAKRGKTKEVWEREYREKYKDYVLIHELTERYAADKSEVTERGQTAKDVLEGKQG